MTKKTEAKPAKKAETVAPKKAPVKKTAAATTPTPTPVAANSIRNTTMLGVLSISAWAGRKNARQHAEKIEAEEGAKKGAMSAAKHLMVGVESHEKLMKFDAGVRKWWSEQTVPWFTSKGGARAASAKAVVPLTEEVGAKMEVREELVRTFLKEYEDTYDARVFDLGGLYNPKEFPLPRDMARRFTWSLSWDTLPNAADIRILDAGIDEATAARMVTDAVKQEEARVAKATEHIARRLFAVVESMHKTMKVKIGEKGAGFHGSKLENITELAELIPSLNFMNDPRLNDLAKEAKKLAMKSPDELKTDEVKRAAAAKEAATLATKLSALFGDDDDEE